MIEITNRPTVLEKPLLYNLNVDPGERYNIAHDHPEIIEDIKMELKKHVMSVKHVENQLEK